MSVTAPQLEQLYLAYFGRPADANGLAFYTALPEWSVWDVAAAFSASPESMALYGATFGPSVVDAIYRNLFGRPAEADGLAYWTGEVASGRLTAAGAALAILLGAQNEDKVAVDHKLAIASLFTAHVDLPAEIAAYAGAGAASTARAFLGIVDATQASVDYATTQVDPVIAALVGTPAGADSGGTGTDTGAGTRADISGTRGDDFLAVAVGGPGGTAIEPGFWIDGGRGNDTLQVTLTGSGGADFDGVQLTGVEHLEVAGAVAQDPGTWIHLGDHSFGTVAFTGVTGGLEGEQQLLIDGFVTSDFSFTAGPERTSALVNFNPHPGSDVDLVDDVIGGGPGSASLDLTLVHHVAEATSIHTILNVLRLNADAAGEGHVVQEVHGGDLLPDVRASVNVSGATSDGSAWSRVETHVTQASRVDVMLGVHGSDSAQLSVFADTEGGSSSDTASLFLGDVTASYDIAHPGASDTGGGVWLVGFEDVSVFVNSGSVMGYLSAAASEGDVASRHQSVAVNAQADLTLLDGVSLGTTGSTELVVYGIGNVDLGTFRGTEEALSDTVRSTIDASGLSGNLTVRVETPVQQVTGGSGDDRIVLADAAGSGTVVDGGEGRDTLQAGSGPDWLVGGAGFDLFVFGSPTDSAPDASDLITDFLPNTIGTADGAAADPASWNGDVMAFDVDTSVFDRIILVPNSADAMNQLQLAASTTDDAVIVTVGFLNSFIGVDWTSDGQIDSYILTRAGWDFTSAAFTLI